MSQLVFILTLLHQFNKGGQVMKHQLSIQSKDPNVSTWVIAEFKTRKEAQAKAVEHNGQEIKWTSGRFATVGEAKDPVEGYIIHRVFTDKELEKRKQKRQQRKNRS